MDNTSSHKRLAFNMLCIEFLVQHLERILEAVGYIYICKYVGARARRGARALAVSVTLPRVRYIYSKQAIYYELLVEVRTNTL